MAEPTLPPVFGKFGVKPAVAVAAKPARSKGLEKATAWMLAAVSSHGALAVKLFLALWIVAVLGAAFFITRT